MKSEKAYTPAQLDNADRTMALLATLPENRRSMAITMANAFIAGMEAQARIAAAQAEMEERLAPVAGAVMVSHEKLDDGLTRTGYDNGWTVYVNYGAQTRTIGGTTIPAMDYAAVKEAA